MVTRVFTVLVDELPMRPHTRWLNKIFSSGGSFAYKDRGRGWDQTILEVPFLFLYTIPILIGRKLLLVSK